MATRFVMRVAWYGTCRCKVNRANRLTPPSRSWHWSDRRGCSSMVEQKPSKLTTRVRFPSPAPTPACRGACRSVGAHEPSEWQQCRGTVEIWSARAAARGDNSTQTRALTHQWRAAKWRPLPAPGEVAEWLKAADCKSARASVRWFESSPLHQSRSAALPVPHDQSGTARS